MTVRLPALCAVSLYPQKKSLVLISVTGWVDHKVITGAGRIRSIEKFNDLIGNRNYYLPACSIVPQPVRIFNYCLFTISGRQKVYVPHSETSAIYAMRWNHTWSRSANPIYFIFKNHLMISDYDWKISSLFQNNKLVINFCIDGLFLLINK
jgi:hypothetical protein